MINVPDTVLRYITDHKLAACDAIVVGCSGGPDSMVLLSLLSVYVKTEIISADIYCVHINHNLRKGECDEDEKLVKSFCEAREIPFISYSFDVRSLASEDGISEETEGRNLRYSSFENYATQLAQNKHYHEVRVAVAHHRDDVSETMMMNLFRGSGLDGLVSLKPQSGKIIRPLLCLCKQDILEYCNECSIPYSVDRTNLENDCTRNVWRNTLLPIIGGSTIRDPEAALTTTHSLLMQDMDYIAGMVDEAYEKCVSNRYGVLMLAVESANALHESIRSRVIRKLWLENFGSLTDFETVNLKLCEGLMGRDAVANGCEIAMPFGHIAFRYDNIFCFCMDEEGADDCACAIANQMGYLTTKGAVRIALEGEIAREMPNNDLSVTTRIIENNGGLEYNIYSWFCPADVYCKGNIVLANVAASDSQLLFRRAGSDSSKCLRRLFTDLKIPKRARDYVLFAYSEDQVLWLPGGGHAIGFTNCVSRERYEANGGTGALVEVRIERVG